MNRVQVSCPFSQLNDAFFPFEPDLNRVLKILSIGKTNNLFKNFKLAS